MTSKDNIQLSTGPYKQGHCDMTSKNKYSSVQVLTNNDTDMKSKDNIQLSTGPYKQ